MHLGRNGGAHAFVAFISDDRNGSCFGDQEVGAGDSQGQGRDFGIVRPRAWQAAPDRYSGDDARGA